MPRLNYLAFQDHPETFLTWLDSNLLQTGFLGNSSQPGGRTTVVLTQRQPSYPGHELPMAFDSGGRSMDVWDIRLHSNPYSLDGLPSYICNYSQNHTHLLMLGNGCNYCFTPNLTGCSIGILHDGNDTVMWHANCGGHGEPQRQTIGDSLSEGLSTPGLSLLEPSMYRHLSEGNTSDNATVFGLRLHGHWSFFFQHYTFLRDENIYQVNGVFPIA